MRLEVKSRQKVKVLPSLSSLGETKSMYRSLRVCVMN